ncbi:hypothetical protein NCZ17_00965 [Acinetobacter modestus]|uniref:hypothetical protein n=1 Tax=Acinetobacter modestus TaxID=1776740 RepID=UPI00202E6C42|nr:hypothetical protein [Acinetobacter modestus]MCM1957942.1 hypothetical protein [Acinetobacter modestus]
MSTPQLSRENALKILEWKGISLEKNPLILLGVRGYYLDTMGAEGKNDRGIYDDAFFWITPTSFISYNGNTDPSSYKKGQGFGSEKGMAMLQIGKWWYKDGIHNGAKKSYPAFRQADDVTVIRDGKAKDYPHTGKFGINIHKGGVNTTSSEGCQTILPSQWDSFRSFGYEKIKQYKLKSFIYCLVDENDIRESGVLKLIEK